MRAADRRSSREPLKKVGDTLIWCAKSPRAKPHRGKVLAILPAGESLFAWLAANGPYVRNSPTDVMSDDRYVLAVTSKHENGLPVVYTRPVMAHDKEVRVAAAARAGRRSDLDRSAD